MKTKVFALGALSAFAVLCLMAAVPSQTDFDPVYFRTNALPVTMIGQLTNWAKIPTNTFGAGTGDVIGSTPLTNLSPLIGNGSKNVSATNAAGFKAIILLENVDNTSDAAKPVSTATTTALSGKQASGNYVTALTGDVTAAGPGSVAATLATVATPGTYRSVTVNAKGLTTSGTNPTTFSGYAISDTSANFAAALSDETGTGAATFATSPTFTTKITLTGGTITTSAPVLDATQTWNAGGVTFTGMKLNVTDTASAAASLLADFQVGGVTKISLEKTGIINVMKTSTDGFFIKGFGELSYYKNALGRSFTLYGDDGGSSTAPATLNFGSGGSINWQSTTRQDSGSIDATISRDSAAVLQLGTDAATATAQALKAHDGSGTDKAGASLTLEGGQSTGTAAAGALIVRTANSAGGTGSSANAYSERAHYVPKWVTLTESTATTIFTIPVPATNFVGLTATVTIYATDGTDHQSLTSVITVDAIAKTTTITPSYSQIDNPAAASAGTLTCDYTAVDAGSNVLAIKANAVSSLTQTVLRAKLVVTAINSNGTGAITEQ